MCEQVEHDEIVVMNVFKQIIVVIFVLRSLFGNDCEADCEYCLSFNHETLFDCLSFILRHFYMPQLCNSVTSYQLNVSFGI